MYNTPCLIPFWKYPSSQNTVCMELDAVLKVKIITRPYV